MNLENKNQTVLVTAGASGIGAVIAGTFLAQGYQVHVCDIDVNALESFRAAHPSAGASMTDVSDPQAVDTLFEELAAMGVGLDVLVNNAGIAGPTAAAENVEVDEWKSTLGVGLDSAFYTSRRAIPLLKQQGSGCIINIASTAALFGYPHRLPYAVAKWGMIGMTKTLAMELGPHNIRVNALCPGSVSGERIDRVIERDAAVQGRTHDEIRDLYTQQVSMRCFVDPEDVAGLALFLASSAGSKISGQAIGVDGHTEGLSWR